MQLFYFPGHLHASFSPVCLGTAFRVGFLLADVAITTGQARMMIDIHLPEHKVSDAAKLKKVLDLFTHQAPDLARRLRELSVIARGISTQKRKDKKMLFALKKYEESLEINYGVYKDCVLRSLLPHKLLPLRDLLTDAAVRNYLSHDSQPENNHTDYTALSRILQMQGNKTDHQNGVEDVVFILPADFLAPSGLPSGAGSIAQALPEGQSPETDEEAVWIEPLLMFPNLSTVEPAELQAVRRQLRAPGETFRKAVDTWLANCHHNRHSVRERARFFEEVIRPAAQPVQHVIEEDRMLAAHRLAFAAEESATVMIFAAEMPLRALWAFYEKEEALPPETMAALRAVWNTEGLRRFPMLLIGPAGAGADFVEQAARQALLSPAADTAQPEENPASVRKRIDLF